MASPGLENPLRFNVCGIRPPMLPASVFCSWHGLQTRSESFGKFGSAGAWPFGARHNYGISAFLHHSGVSPVQSMPVGFEMCIRLLARFDKRHSYRSSRVRAQRPPHRQLRGNACGDTRCSRSPADRLTALRPADDSHLPALLSSTKEPIASIGLEP